MKAAEGSTCLKIQQTRTRAEVTLRLVDLSCSSLTFLLIYFRLLQTYTLGFTLFFFFFFFGLFVSRNMSGCTGVGMKVSLLSCLLLFLELTAVGTSSYLYETHHEFGSLLTFATYFYNHINS